MTGITSPLLGVNITEALSSNDAVGGINNTATRGFQLGTRVMGDDNTEFMFVTAGSALTQYDCVAIDENYEAHPITKARADDGHMVGFAQTALAINEYGWIALRGSNISCRVLGGCAADVALYTSATAGVLDDESSGTTNIDGVVLVAAGGSSNGVAVSKEVIATWPRSTTF